MAFKFVTILISVGSIFDIKVKYHSRPVHIQANVSKIQMERFTYDFHSRYLDGIKFI